MIRPRAETVSSPIHEIFAAWDQADAPGCACVVRQHGRVVHAAGFGQANLEFPTPITTDRTTFHVASVAKSVTAAAAALLAADGVLDLDGDIRRSIEWLPDLGHAITPRQLMHHTSGLRDEMELLALGGWRPDDTVTLDDLVEVIAAQRELNFAPGTGHVYSNTGYLLLALLIEHIAGSSLDEFCRSRLFEPLGLDATSIHDHHQKVVPGRATAYRPGPDGGWRTQGLPWAAIGSSSLDTTAHDLARWGEALCTGQVGGPEVMRVLTTPGRLRDGTQLRYAGGLMVRDRHGHVMMGHAGGDAAFSADVVWAPAEQLVVAVVSNNLTAPASRLADRVLDQLLGLEEAGTTWDPGDLSRFAGLFHDPHSGVTHRLTIDDGALAVERYGLRLRPTAEREFSAPTLPLMQVRFAADLNAVSIPLPGPGHSRFERVDERGEPCRASAIAGSYLCRELDVVHHLIEEDGCLLVRRRRQTDAWLVHLFGNRFVTRTAPDVLPFEIALDVEGEEVTGFRLTTGRVRGLRFVRLD